MPDLAVTAVRSLAETSFWNERSPRGRDDDEALVREHGRRAARRADADAVFLGKLPHAGDLLPGQPLARPDALAQRRTNGPVRRFCSAHGADARCRKITAPGYRASRISSMISMDGWS